MECYDEIRFRRSVDEALQVVARVLGANRNPVIPSDTHHTYEDKVGINCGAYAYCRVHITQ